MSFVPKMERVMDGSELRSITLGHPLVDSYLEFVGARGAVNTWLATAYDLKVFFEVVGGKDPSEVSAADVFAFLGHSKLATTDRYLSAKLRPEELERLDRAFTSASSRAAEADEHVASR